MFLSAFAELSATVEITLELKIQSRFFKLKISGAWVLFKLLSTRCLSSWLPVMVVILHNGYNKIDLPPFKAVLSSDLMQVP